MYDQWRKFPFSGGRGGAKPQISDNTPPTPFALEKTVERGAVASPPPAPPRFPPLCMTAPNHESFATPLSLRSTTINKTVIAYTNKRDTTANNFIKSIFVKIDWSICKDMGSFIS
jgi:hypothetical protein